MKLVLDANVVFALIVDSRTRVLVVALEPDLLTPIRLPRNRDLQ
ncbi:MAG: hypothetical protein ACOCUO_00845 [archaeon]